MMSKVPELLEMLPLTVNELVPLVPVKYKLPIWVDIYPPYIVPTTSLYVEYDEVGEHVNDPDTPFKF